MISLNSHPIALTHIHVNMDLIKAPSMITCDVSQ